MNATTYSFRHADRVIGTNSAWTDLDQVIRSLDRQTVIDTQRQLTKARGKPRKGAQSAINQYFESQLTPQLGARNPRARSAGPEELDASTGWRRQVRLFEGTGPDVRGWTMDFVREGIGVEVSFNHAEAIPWTLTRLTLAGEADDIRDRARIEAGIAIFATTELKAWGNMDGAVGTFDQARAWIGLMRPILPIPILLIGLDTTGWRSAPAGVFPGTARGTRGGRSS